VDHCSCVEKVGVSGPSKKPEGVEHRQKQKGV
jgi:hypothetical protein